jgi:crotonobetainyl-CoA:carnitine CoA-transferase CaiB-like acyl-CoA transferase
MSGPLSKVKILDFTHLLPGELCSTILADLGCEVLRIESLKPGLAQTMPPLVDGESLYYWSVHRNKKRIRLDLKTEEGTSIVRALCAEYDIVLENFRPGVMNRLKLGYKQLKKINNALVYCSISGYGQESAWNQRPGHDLNFVAESGILDLNRNRDSAPVIPGALISDFLAAAYGALSVTSALYERDRTGQGKHLDISMFECALSTMNILSTALLYSGAGPESGRSMHQTELPNYNIYECSDRRYLAVASLEPQFWQIFCKVVSRPDLAQTYKGGPDAQVRKQVSEIIRSKPLKKWLELFEGTDCCVSPVHTLAEALDFLPARERQIVTTLVHPKLGKVPQLATPVAGKKNGGKRNGSEHHEARDLADDTLATLKSIGYSRRQIDRLVSEGIIAV